ncbi:MAG: dihydroorotase [Anaerofustis stercorihominis]|nr:dihydroorotase [Anaerofustis stercorihominis]
MKLLLKNALVLGCNNGEPVDVAVVEDKISDIRPGIDSELFDVCIDIHNSYIFPGFVDVHVHMREPGFSYKETIKTASLAAAHGGYTDVFAMPNLNPVPDSVENIGTELELLKDSVINAYPYASITVKQDGKELVNFSELNKYAAAFSDDGKGVQDDEIMREAMREAAKTGKVIAAHCEVNELLNGGYIHDGVYAKEHGHKGISSASEYEMIKRDIELLKEVDCKYHVCHVSTKESVEAIRQAKKDGLNITCETAPHYLILCDEDLQEDGRFKMNPPLRGKEDRAAMIQGVIDGTVDMIATDHAPHSAEEKGKGLQSSSMGIVGLETAFPLLYTYLVKENVITLEKLIAMMTKIPAERFGIESDFKIGGKANLCVYDLNDKYTIDPEEFLSKGRSTPFKGFEVYGRCLMTVCEGRIVYQDKNI